MKTFKYAANDPHNDHYVIQTVSRELAVELIAEDTLRELDAAKRQIAETIGVREEHIGLEIQMLILAQI